MPRCTKAQQRERARAVMELLLSDTPRADILEHARKTWVITRGQTDKYIAAASEMIRVEGDKLCHQAFALHLVKLSYSRHSALKAGDSRLAFDILRDLAKIQNLYPPKEKKIQTVDIDLSKLSNEQLQRISNGEDPVTVAATQGVNYG